MKAAVLNPATYQFEIINVANPSIEPHQVLIQLKASSLNHHELWSLQEKNLDISSGIIMGSDGSGIVVEIGNEVDKSWIDKSVIINPSINWGTDTRVQGQHYEILGHPTQGTFAEYIVIDSNYIEEKPEHLSYEEAAALPLAGLTAYRALFTRGELEPENKVLITGVGGGAAQFALLYAIHAGAEVYVTSGDNQKIKKSIELGAQGGANYKNSDWDKTLVGLAGGFDVIIDSAAGKGFSTLTELANPGARISLFGRTAGKIPELNPKILFWKQLSIHGTTMGTHQEFSKMIEFVIKNKVKPVIDSVFELDKIAEGFHRMSEVSQFGKIVVRIN